MNPTTSPTPATPVYRDGTWIYSANGTVRACFEYIGEGYNGDYDETDPHDAALYRLDVNIRTESLPTHVVESLDAEETDDPEWVYPADGSICTAVRMDDTDEAQARILLAYAAESLAAVLTSDSNSVRGTMDRLSWLPDLR